MKEHGETDCSKWALTCFLCASITKVVKRVLKNGAHELIDYEGVPLAQLRNGLYLKKYYA